MNGRRVPANAPGPVMISSTMKVKSQQIMARVRAWQNDPDVHPLTCENDRAHRRLEPVEMHGAVILRCPECGYEQTDIPAVVLLDPSGDLL